MMTHLSVAALFCIGALQAADWNPRLAAQYMDGRQQEWSLWPRAKATGGACVSCHTGVTYLLARPVLRRVLGEKAPTQWETELLNGLRARVDKTVAKDLRPVYTTEPAASQALGTESVLAAWAFSLTDPAGADTKKAFDRMWSLQLREGKGAGAWTWFMTDLDPWEEPESQFFGASLAAMAAVQAKAAGPGVAALGEYLRSNAQDQTLQNRLMLLWASRKMPDLIDKAVSQRIVDAALQAQNPDGGWAMESLGPFKKHEAAPAAAPGSNAYATAFTTFVLQQAGVGPGRAEIRRALSWLIEHQDRETGSWAAVSMNKTYEPDSMQSKFMRDAATAYAVMALASGKTGGGM